MKQKNPLILDVKQVVIHLKESHWTASMLVIFLLHIIITAICSLAGLLFYLVIPKETERDRKPLVFYPVTGLVVITLISQVAALFTPINSYFSLCLLALLFFLVLIKKTHVISFYLRVFAYLKDQPAILLLLTGVIWLMIVVLNAGPTMMDDTESYHIQMVKWVNEYGTVPGIANLHYRFGLNSSWFTSISFFLPVTHSPNFFTTLNGIISVWFCGFLVSQLKPLLKQKKDNSVSAIHIGIVLVLVLSFFCWPMIRANGSTANYDFITTALVLILFIKILQQGKQLTGNRFIAELIIWPVYLFTVRIINYPLLLLSIYGFYLLLKNREWQRTAVFFFLSVFLVAAFLARNVMLAGYPFYPSTAFNFFKADWKVDDEMIRWLTNYIKYYNRVNEGLLSIEETEKLNFPDWVFAWFRYMYYYDKPVVVAGLSGLLLNLFFLKRALRIYSTTILFFIAVICVQLLSWFFIAPDPRFVYGCLLCGAILLPVLLLKNKDIKINSTVTSYFFICLIAAIVAYTVLKAGRNKAYQSFLLPYALPHPPVKEVIVDNITLKIPEKILNNWNPRCYATDLPCLYIVNPKLRARGKTIRRGFRLEK